MFIHFSYIAMFHNFVCLTLTKWAMISIEKTTAFYMLPSVLTYLDQNIIELSFSYALIFGISHRLAQVPYLAQGIGLAHVRGK